MAQIATDEMRRFMVDVLKKLIESSSDGAAFTHAVRLALEQIVKKYTTREYAFNLSLEYFVGHAPSSCYEAMKTILQEDIDKADDFHNDEDHLDVAFAAYYALSLIYKKQNAREKLEHLVSEIYDALDGYPLRFEVKARYYKRIGEYDKALHNDERAIRILEKNGVTNPAVGISYASTVCQILENTRRVLDAATIERARKNIEDAISFNPDYPKYYFLKAKILFYSVPRSASEEELQKTIADVYACIDDAEDALFAMFGGKGIFKVAEEQVYDDFRAHVRAALEKRGCPLFPQDHKTLDHLKQRILAAESQDICTATSILPPVPDLKKGDKYFFICYSSQDFHSVYCDLIELYKRNVPFRYDERLTNGTDWKQQIERYVSDPDCVGVVFYLSRNILTTDSVCTEIDIVKKHKKQYFAINLEGSLSPSKILIQIILQTCSMDAQDYPISGETMHKYLGFFHDSDVFTHTIKDGEDSGTAHLDAYIKNIETSFPAIIIGERT